VKTVLASVLLAAAAVAAAPAIGIVTASGHFTVGTSEVWGNATLFDGAVVKTAAASSELALRNGAKVQLGATSSAHVYEDRVTLDAGVGQIAPAKPFELDAAGFKVRGAGVRVDLGKTVEVAALSGPARVFGASGVLLATVPAGRHMSLAFQAAQNGTLSRSGCMLYRDGQFILQDDNTQEVVQLSGNRQDLTKNLGNRVQVQGTASTARPAVSIATSVLAVASVAPVSEGGCLVVAANLNASTQIGQPAAGAAPGTPATPATPAATASTHTGLSTGAKVGIVAAVAGGGAGAAIALSGHKKSTSP
jgi:hypothetical protein